jgi:hypothetical protein
MVTIKLARQSKNNISGEMYERLVIRVGLSGVGKIVNTWYLAEKKMLLACRL